MLRCADSQCVTPRAICPNRPRVMSLVSLHFYLSVWLSVAWRSGPSESFSCPIEGVPYPREGVLCSIESVWCAIEGVPCAIEGFPCVIDVVCTIEGLLCFLHLGERESKWVNNIYHIMVQCVAVCCSILQCNVVAVCCSVLQCVAVC